MKYLIPIILLFTSCKQDCKTCVTFTSSNYFEAEKKCNGEIYDLSDFTESLDGEDKGTVCSEEEEYLVESETSEEYILLCDSVGYWVYYFVKCSY